MQELNLHSMKYMHHKILYSRWSIQIIGAYEWSKLVGSASSILAVSFSFISLQNCDWHKLMQRWDCFSIPSCMPYFPISSSYIFTMICLSYFISIQDAIYISINVMTFYQVRKIETHNVYFLNNFLNKVGMGWKISLLPKCFWKDPIE